MSERYNALRFACLYRARNNVDGFWIRGASSLKAYCARCRIRVGAALLFLGSTRALRS